MKLKNCYNYNDFRKLAKKNLPAPIFHYIDGGSDDEVTLKRNTDSFSKCDLIPNILASVGEPDMSTEVFGKDTVNDYRFTRSKIGIAAQEFSVDWFFPIEKLLFLTPYKHYTFKIFSFSHFFPIPKTTFFQTFLSMLLLKIYKLEL